MASSEVELMETLEKISSRQGEPQQSYGFFGSRTNGNIFELLNSRLKSFNLWLLRKSN